MRLAFNTDYDQILNGMKSGHISFAGFDLTVIFGASD
jgi:hypothetical protein